MGFNTGFLIIKIKHEEDHHQQHFDYLCEAVVAYATAVLYVLGSILALSVSCVICKYLFQELIVLHTLTKNVYIFITVV